MRIFKYPIEITDIQDLILPADSKILSFQFQNGMPCIWALVHTAAGTPDVRRRIHIYGTGHPIIQQGQFVGTVQQPNSPFVWHLFDQGEIS